MIHILLQSKANRINTLITALRDAGERPHIRFAMQSPDQKGTQNLLPGIRFSLPGFTADEYGFLTLNLSVAACPDLQAGDVITGKTRLNGMSINFEIPAYYITAVFVPNSPFVAQFELITPTAETETDTQEAPQKKKAALKLVH